MKTLAPLKTTATTILPLRQFFMKKLSSTTLLIAVFALMYPQLPAEVPTVHSDGSATFRIDAPGARSVQVDVKGRTNAKNDGKPFSMTKNDQGVWTHTSEPLDPGFHYYFLFIDGYRFADTTSPLYFGWQRPTNGVEIPDPNVNFYKPRQVDRGEIHIRPYYSDITREWRDVYVYTPPDYARNTGRSYPVLYLQHGSGENQTSWSNQGRMGIILDNLIADKQCQPMIVVMEHGYAYSPDGKTDESGRPMNRFEDLLIQETIPLIEDHYRVKADQENRAIAGLSMGAGQANRIALQNLDLFDYLGCFSGGGRDTERMIEMKSEINGELDLLWIGCGTEDFLYERVATMHQELKQAGVEHEFFAHQGTHEWQAWREHLRLFAPRLFKK